MKMDAALMEIWKLLSVSPVGSSQAPPPPLKEAPKKKKSLGEVKTSLPQKQVKELVARMDKIEIPTSTPATGKAKKTGRDSRTPSSEPSIQRKSVKKKKKKGPSLESEDGEESTKETRSLVESEEEAEPSTPAKEEKEDEHLSFGQGKARP